MIKKNKIILELNEFSVELLRKYESSHNNIKKLLAWDHLITSIPDTYQSDFLEPWSQWVSIHTGLPCKEHNIKHLGDIDQLKEIQAWDAKPERFGIVWGCLNSKNPTSQSVKYFPDPWTRESSTNIEDAEILQKFLRLSVSSRGGSIFTRFKHISRLVYSGFQIVPFVIKNIDKPLFKIVKKYGLLRCLNISVIYTLIEYLAFNYFLTLGESEKNKKHTDIFFFNFLAHCQHYFWSTRHHYRIDIAMDFIEIILEKLASRYDKIHIINGLSQEFSADKEQWHSYIPRNGWEVFIRRYISKSCIVEACMSYDSNILFDSKLSLNKAKDNLDSIKTMTSGHKVFLTEINPTNPLKLFVRLDYFGNTKEKVVIDNQVYSIDHIFSLAGIRTARHVQSCDLFTNEISTTKLKATFNYNLYNIYE
ncbi:hypothetical protein OAO12_01835 [Methylophilaceae bacterium]|nr:hypothetical protein [Methylophilaceae bacterium]